MKPDLEVALEAVDDQLFWEGAQVDPLEAWSRVRPVSDSGAWIALGATLAAHRCHDGAAEAYLQARRSKDFCRFLRVEAGYRWARVFLLRGNTNLALRMARESLSLSKPGLQRSAVAFRLASIKGAVQDIEGAASALEMAAEALPETHPLRYTVALQLMSASLQAVRSPRRAEEILRGVVGRLPSEHPRVAWVLGQTLAACGRYGLAETALETAAGLPGLEGAFARLDLLGARIASGQELSASDSETLRRHLTELGCSDCLSEELRESLMQPIRQAAAIRALRSRIDSRHQGALLLGARSGA